MPCYNETKDSVVPNYDKTLIENAKIMHLISRLYIFFHILPGSIAGKTALWAHPAPPQGSQSALHYRAIQNLYYNSQIYYKMLTLSRSWAKVYINRPISAHLCWLTY
jgi:hypothetical protein